MKEGEQGLVEFEGFPGLALRISVSAEGVLVEALAGDQVIEQMTLFRLPGE